MELFRNTDGAIAEIIQSSETDPSVAEDDVSNVIEKVLAEAAFKNLITEAGEVFLVEVPGSTDISAVDLRTQPSTEDSPPRAVPLGVMGNTALFQATETKAVVRHVEK